MTCCCHPTGKSCLCQGLGRGGHQKSDNHHQPPNNWPCAYHGGPMCAYMQVACQDCRYKTGSGNVLTVCPKGPRWRTVPFLAVKSDIHAASCRHTCPVHWTSWPPSMHEVMYGVGWQYITAANQLFHVAGVWLRPVPHHKDKNLKMGERQHPQQRSSVKPPAPN